MRIYYPLTEADKKRDASKTYTLSLPIGVNFAKVRVHPTGLMPGCVGVDFQIEKNPGSNVVSVVWLRSWPEIGHGETWFLEAILEEIGSDGDFSRDQLEDKVRGLRRFHRGACLAGSVFFQVGIPWQSVHMALVTLLESTVWGYITSDGESVSSYPPSLWNPLRAIDNDELSKGEVLEKDGLWRLCLKIEPPQNNSVKLLIQGVMPKPSQASIAALADFVQFCCTYAIPEAPSSSPTEQDNNSKPLPKLLQEIRHELSAEFKRYFLAGGGSQGAANDSTSDAVLPCAILFTSITDDKKGFCYCFDQEQEDYLKKLCGRNVLTIDEFELLKKMVTGVDPQRCVGTLEMSGLTWEVRKSRLALVLPWKESGPSTESSTSDSSNMYPANFRKAEDKAFTQGGKIPWFMVFPIISRSRGKDDVELVAYIAAQPSWPPPTSELIASILRLFMAKSPAIASAIVIDEHARNWAKYEFVRSLSYFMGHNLPKTLITPLLLIAKDLKSTSDRSDLNRMATRLEAIAGLSQSMLRALDIFRIPGKCELKPEDVELGDILEKVKLMFDELLANRSELMMSWAAIKDRVILEVVKPSEKIWVKAFSPTLFHAILVPVDNALKALDVAAVKNDAKRGVVHVTITKGEGGETVIEVVDHGKGVPPDRLPKIQARLASIPEEIGRPGGVDFFNRPTKASGSNLGIGLMLTAVTAAVLKDGDGHRGTVAIVSSTDGPQQGTRVVIRLPHNLDQEMIVY